MMDSFMAVEDWATMPDYWSSTSDQWPCFVDPLFNVIGNKSDVAGYQLVGDDVIYQHHAWSDGGPFLEEAVTPVSSLQPYSLASSPQELSTGTDIQSLDELPSSLESFVLINPNELHHDYTANTGSLPLLESSGSATDCELSTDDLLLDLDDMISDVIMNSLKPSDIGLSLPPVSADDVESLLSSCLVSTAAGLGSGTVLLDSGALTFPEQMEVSDPVEMRRTEAVITPAPEDMAPSPASSQSSDSAAVSTDRKRRKKEQNKTAAQKYREKKRGQKGIVLSECDELERRNVELRTRVEEMTREVDYLKGLIEEICA